MPRLCERCGLVDLSAEHVYKRFCQTCWRVSRNERRARVGARRAHSLVEQAIARGDLPRAATLVCVDCGAGAHNYDHRDYSRPLEVEAVCYRCNGLRGPARLLEEDQADRDRWRAHMARVQSSAKGYSKRGDNFHARANGVHIGAFKTADEASAAYRAYRFGPQTA